MPFGPRGIYRLLPRLTWQARAQVDRVLARVPPSARVVDLGAGGRRISPGTIAVDFVADGNTDVVADVQRLPFADGSIDLAYGCSLFTHLLEPDCKHYLHEVRRVLSPSGLFLPTIHINPEPGARFSGSEKRVDIDVDYFVELAAEAGLELEARLGKVCGQYALLFKRAPARGA